MSAFWAGRRCCAGQKTWRGLPSLLSRGFPNLLAVIGVTPAFEAGFVRSTDGGAGMCPVAEYHFFRVAVS
jgi:hypothetical protein